MQVGVQALGLGLGLAGHCGVSGQAGRLCRSVSSGQGLGALPGQRDASVRSGGTTAGGGRRAHGPVSLQVTGRAALQSTTLLSLGLTGGSAIIRWGL